RRPRRRVAAAVAPAGAGDLTPLVSGGRASGRSHRPATRREPSDRRNASCGTEAVPTRVRVPPTARHGDAGTEHAQGTPVRPSAFLEIALDQRLDTVDRLTRLWSGGLDTDAVPLTRAQR